MGLRILELNGAIGVLGLMVLLTKQDLIKGWVMKIAVRVLPERWYLGT